MVVGGCAYAHRCPLAVDRCREEHRHFANWMVATLRVTEPKILALSILPRTRPGRVQEQADFELVRHSAIRRAGSISG